MELRNFLTLNDDPDEALVRFRDHLETTRDIVDPLTRAHKTVHVLEFVLESVNGRATDARYSVLSDREFALWAPYLPGRGYAGRTFRIRKTGRGYRRETSIEAVP